MKAVEILSARNVVSCVLVGVSAWFVSGQLSYHVGWKHAAHVHTAIGAPGLDNDVRQAMFDVEHILSKGGRSVGIATTVDR